MSRKIKVYNTNCFPPYDLCKALHKLGAPKHARQFHIICGATSMAEANRICEEQGIGSRVFISGDASITGNEQALGLAGSGGIFIEVKHFLGEYYSIEQLKAIAEEIDHDKKN